MSDKKKKSEDSPDASGEVVVAQAISQTQKILMIVGGIMVTVAGGIITSFLIGMGVWAVSIDRSMTTLTVQSHGIALDTVEIRSSLKVVNDHEVKIQGNTKDISNNKADIARMQQKQTEYDRVLAPVKSRR